MNDDTDFASVLRRARLPVEQLDTPDQHAAAQLTRGFVERVMEIDVGDDVPALSFDPVRDQT